VIDVDQSPSDYLTNAPVEGESLARRMARSRLSVEEALRYAIEIGAILSSSHRQGQVHGSLSPDSLVITAKGVRILQPSADAPERLAPYRSPEQVRGEPPDSRSDVFTYGALLYELATGHRAFAGAGEELDREILEGTPPPEDSPAWNLMQPVIAACLQKSPLARKQRLHNAVIELKFISLSRRMSAARASRLLLRRPALKTAQYVELQPQANNLPRRSWILGVVLALILVAVSAAAVVGYLYQRHGAGAFAFRVELPPHTRFPEMPAVSPDGSFLTLSAVGPEGQRMLWLRPLNELRYEPVPGTEGGNQPFWSPDGRYIGFFANLSLKKVPRAGGEVETICAVESSPGGGTWNSDDTIVFAPGFATGLSRVQAAANATSQPMLALNAARGESAFLWPQFLPDGKHFLFFAQTGTDKSTGVYVGALDSRQYRMLLNSETNAVFSANAEWELQKKGYLLFMHDRSLMAQSFNLAHLSLDGDFINVIEDVGSLTSLSRAPVSVSNNGMLVYQTVAGATRQMVWLDRNGRTVAAVEDPGEWGEPRVSPDGTRAVAAKLGPDGENADLWLVDLDGKTSQFTNTPFHENSPVWSPAGSGIVFSEFGPAAGNFDLYFSKALSGIARPELLLKSQYPKHPMDWSRDGRYILFNTLSPGTKGDIWALSLPDRHAGPILATIYNEGFPALSPDGRWMAFQSDETGKSEVFVERFHGIDSTSSRHWLISRGGGHPRWRMDGQELYYITPAGRMMVVPVHPSSGETFDFDAPRALFQSRPLPRKWNLYDVTPDGQRFLLNLPLELANSNTLSIVTNWAEKLKQPAAQP